mmetsp:Transcript_148342/g.458530  ORF Transcript_148342/g.458530 Transcript_148342/m.458530 type:complete len:246 (+) Transcript_148342:222-959(+)
MSASLQASSWCVLLHMMRKVSPLFLFGAPWNSSTTPCTISAMRLTNVITWACSTSVAMEKSRIRREPMMHSTRMPSTMALTQALSTPSMLCSMIFTPASPNPSASNEPSVMMVFSRITVSISSSGSSWVAQSSVSYSALHQPFASMNMLLLSSDDFCWIIASLQSCSWVASSATFMAMSGFARMVSTLAIMFSTGYSTRWLASLEKSREAKVSAKQRNTVTASENTLSFSTKGRTSKKKTKCQSW